MNTLSPRVVDGRIEPAARSDAPSPERAVACESSIPARTFTADHWLIDLLAFALAALLVGGVALYGLDLVSSGEVGLRPSADRVVPDDCEATPVASAGWVDLLGCHEPQ